METIVDTILAGVASLTVMLSAYMALLSYLAYVDPDRAVILLRLAGFI